MIRKMLILLFILIMGAIHAPAMATAQSASNPYIFYFSHDLKAFVIERADRSESRTLGEGVLKRSSYFQGSFLISGPGWSPSGEWLAFTAAEGYRYNVGKYLPYLIRSDGSRTIPLGDLTNPVMVWSPDRDLLLVAAQWQDDPTNENTLVQVCVFLVDPSGNRTTMLVNRSYNNSSYSLGNPVPIWRNDTEFMVQFYAGTENRYANNEVRKISILIGDIHGSWSEKVYGNAVSNIFFREGRAVSKAGNVLTEKGDRLIAENIFSGKRFEVLKKSTETPQVYWSPTEQYGILIDESVWWIDGIRQKATMLRAIYDNDPGNTEVAPQWSPDGKHAVFYSERILYRVSIDTGVARPMAIYPDGVGSFARWFWKSPATLHFYERAETDPPRDVFRQYNFQTGQRDWIELPEADIGYPVRFSPDGKFLAGMSDGAKIWDIGNQVIYSVSPASRAYNSFGGGEVVWSADSEWLLTFDDALVAGGGKYRHVSVVRRDGTMRRDLTWADVPQPNYFAFLPAQVTISKLPLPSESLRLERIAPLSRLYGDEWNYFLSWSPDGRMIAATGIGPTMRLWDITKKSMHLLPDPVPPNAHSMGA
jgi:WD40 repeat protein